MVSRRKFVGGVMGAAVVLGFDPTARSWVSVAEAHGRGRGHHGSPFRRVPRLEGELVTALDVRESLSSDVGNYIVQVPAAVLRPACARDIAKMVRFCRRHDIPIAARGQGHTTHGQSLADAGLMIDMSSMSTIHSIDSCTAEVDAGVLWKDLLAEAVPMGLTPPVLTGYLGLSIGGTLSVGGVSSGYDRGSQGDHVLELEIVTGEGRVVRCSETRHRDLFLGALAGLGQLGIITRAVVELVPAFPRARTYVLPYFDNATFFADARTLLGRNELDDIYNIWVPADGGGWLYLMQATVFYDPASPPDDDFLRRDLSYFGPASQIIDLPYQQHALQVDVAINQLKAAGLFDNTVHPFFDVWLPDSHVESYIGQVLPTLTPQDVGAVGFMLLFPHRRERFTRPFFRVPDDEYVWLFDILTANDIPGPDPAFAAQMLARNRFLYDKARAVGGTRYPIGSLEFTEDDWRDQYGFLYPILRLLQRRYDPDALLSPNADNV